jgi:hypothetical protein
VQELGRKVVAEGVERAEDVTFLRSIGAEYAQGYYYGEPMPEREIMSMLRVIRKSERKLQRRGYFRAKPKRVDTTPEVDGLKPAASQQAARQGGKSGRSKKQGAASASPQDMAANLNSAQSTGAPAQRPRLGGELPPGATRLRPRSPQAPLPNGSAERHQTTVADRAADSELRPPVSQCFHSTRCRR